VAPDGIIDLVTALFSREHFAVLLGTGGGRFQVAQRYAGSGASDVTLGDLNGDGRLDVALAVADDDSVAVRLGGGDGSFGPPQAYASGAFPFGVSLADVNHDGKLDIAAANYDGSTVSVFLGVGDGTFGPRSRYLMGHQLSDTGTTNVDTVVVADLDRDGNLDIAAPEYEQPIVRRGRGDGTFEAQRAVSEGYFTTIGGPSPTSTPTAGPTSPSAGHARSWNSIATHSRRARHTCFSTGRGGQRHLVSSLT
jgi:hypothetical protein